MKPGNLKFIFILFALSFINLSFVIADEKIQSVPLINLEELEPTFEEDKDELEKNEKNSLSLENNNETINNTNVLGSNKIYINLTALDKITAKTSFIRLAIGEKKSFGSLEIKALKCMPSDNNDIQDAVAYIQVKDLYNKDNNQVFLFNGWTFVSSPSLQSMDHPVYDLWITSCENI
jgi:hypothetical protein